MAMRGKQTGSTWVVALGTVLAVTSACSSPTTGDSPEALPGNRYAQSNLAATGDLYAAPFTISSMVNAWGVAIRPKGAGGHFWVGAGGTSYEFVGDVTASPDPALRQLHQDGLKEV
ncbi:hypothetical protein SAMN05444583_122101, partial [Rhodococcus maanshanensis]